MDKDFVPDSSLKDYDQVVADTENINGKKDVHAVFISSTGKIRVTN